MVQWVFNLFSIDPPLPPSIALSDNISDNTQETPIMTWYAHPILEWVSRIARRISAWVLNLFNIFNVFRQQQPSPLSEVVRDTQIETRLTHPILVKVMRFARRTSAMPGVAAGAQNDSRLGFRS